MTLFGDFANGSGDFANGIEHLFFVLVIVLKGCPGCGPGNLSKFPCLRSSTILCSTEQA